MTIVKCKWLLLIRTHPSPSLALPLHRFVNPGELGIFLFCFAFELDNDLTADWRQVTTANHGRVGMPLANEKAIVVCPPIDRWHHLVLLAHHLCLQEAIILSHLIVHPPEFAGSDKERESVCVTVLYYKRHFTAINLWTTTMWALMFDLILICTQLQWCDKILICTMQCAAMYAINVPPV